MLSWKRFLAITALVVIIPSILINPNLALCIAAGCCIGLAWSMAVFTRRMRDSGREPSPFLETLMSINIGALGAVVACLLIFVATPDRPAPSDSNALYADSEIVPVRCSAMVTYRSSVAKLIIDYDTAVDPSDFSLRVPSKSYTEPDLHNALITCMTANGWKYTGRLRGSLRFARRHFSKVVFPRFHATRILEVDFPCFYIGRILLLPDPGSVARIVAPRYAVYHTYPASTVQMDRLEDGMMEYVLPMGGTGEYRARIQVVRPLLQNSVGKALVNLSFWPALKWLLIGIGVIFSDQIKKQLLVPAVKNAFRLLHIKYVVDPAAKAN